MNMKAPPYLVAAGLVLSLAACSPGATDYTESEAPKDLVLDNASSRVDVHFAPGSSHLYGRDAARLRRMAATGGIVPSDRITVATNGGPGLAAARFRTIAALLLPYGVVASQGNLAPLPANHAIIDTGRYLVTLPPCPNWSKDAAIHFNNATASNFGCSTMVNLGLSAASPADLVQGRPVGFAEGEPASSAVDRYLADKVILPASSGVGPIGSTNAGNASGSGGVPGAAQ
jgi:pilus assembly protein CpaD